MSEIPLIYEAFVTTREWRVERVVGEDIEFASFSGPEAEERARAYAEQRYGVAGG